mgnify:CR=1 FL=1
MISDLIEPEQANIQPFECISVNYEDIYVHIEPYRINSMQHGILNNETICALSTPAGTGAISVIRISGKDAIKYIDRIFFPASSGEKQIREVKSHTLHFGEIRDDDETIDQAVVGVFREPNSYTGEDVIEISCHGSEYIQQRILQLLTEHGARLARPGEFTLRAFLNNKMDLSQAEAVADLIYSNSKAAHDLAMNQMRGYYSERIRELRQKLIHVASLLELELDFSEEDVEFADRREIHELLDEITGETERLSQSFSMGNVIRKGIPVAIVGKPNVGKSTLLNAILNEEKAIVSEIPGTTRDAIEDTIIIGGIAFRFIDTAGLRESRDSIETIGIERTHEKIRQAKVILYVFDAGATEFSEISETLAEFREFLDREMEAEDPKFFIPIANKTDLLVESPKDFKSMVEIDILFVSAKRKENINLIIDKLSEYVKKSAVSDETVVSNARHYEALSRAGASIAAVKKGFQENLPTDLITSDMRNALHYLGEITGEITTNEILDNIFSRFCIGK